MPGSVISITNNKGGCGKTTTACNLAHALAKNKKKVLVIDNDSQCNSSAMLMQDTDYGNCLFHIIGENAPVETCIYSTQYENIHCMPNNPKSAAFEIHLARNIEKSLLLYQNKLKKHISTNFDIILVDNPPNIGTFTAMSLYMSDFVIIPNEAGSKFSLEGLMNAVSFINDIRTSKKNSNPGLRFLRLLITKVDKRTNASNAIIQHIKKTFPKDQVFKTLIPVNAAFQQAELMNETLVGFRPNTPGAKAYMSVAKELIKILNKGERL